MRHVKITKSNEKNKDFFNHCVSDENDKTPSGFQL
jgi:hypothetical protein